MDMSSSSVVIVGRTGGTHIGASLARAARRLGMQVWFIDGWDAFRAPRLVRGLTWRLGGHRPPALRAVSRAVAAACVRRHPRLLISTGLTPIEAHVLEELGRQGVIRLNYLTDDPWNPWLRSKWFLQGLSLYDHVFSPRRANIDDLMRHGCRTVSYLPFGYDAELMFPEEPGTVEEWSRFAADVVFVGAADRDRAPYVEALLRAGLRVSVYGDDWRRHWQLRAVHRGYADPPTLRKATRAAKVALCLVRRANRDGHVMRSFEIPALGGCMLAEDTTEHRALFGRDRASVAYFRGPEEMVVRVRELLEHPEERQRLAITAERLVRSGSNTYDDRLSAMLAACRS